MPELQPPHLRPRLDAMKSSRPGPTRTADPRPPDHFPARGNYPVYLLFGVCGGFLLLTSLLVLRGVWALVGGEAAWNAFVASLSHPLYIGYHALALLGVVWFSLRFFSIFPKTQPARIGPVKPPPAPVILAILNGGFAVANALLALILWGELL